MRKVALKVNANSDSSKTLQKIVTRLKPTFEGRKWPLDKVFLNPFKTIIIDLMILRIGLTFAGSLPLRSNSIRFSIFGLKKVQDRFQDDRLGSEAAFSTTTIEDLVFSTLDGDFKEMFGIPFETSGLGILI